MQNPYSLILVAVIFISSCHKENLQSNTNCTDFLENWDIQISEYNPGIQKQNDIFFPSDQIGYSVGNAGSIMRTINGGTSWEVIQHYYLPEEGINKLAPTKAILKSVYFINDSIGFAGGQGEDYGIKSITDAVLLSTTNKGISWTKQYLAGIREINDLYFTDSKNGLGLFTVNTSQTTSQLQVQMTSNAGHTWQKVNLPITKIKSRYFTITDTKVILIGEEAGQPVLLTSHDYGISWDYMPLPEENCNQIYFINDEYGFATCGLLFYPERTYKTSDGGTSWHLTNTPYNSYSTIHFSSLLQGFIINPKFELIQNGIEPFEEIQYFDVYQTSDGGENWRTSKISSNCNFTGINFAPSNNTFYTLGYTANKFFIK
ncbi:MAG: hypothetical protein H6568_11085 [Lewinellaceae bacterium]|mgnify:CR=1 FL=1|nr:hypothetical protein [Lewinellaceae bacterium]